MGSQDTNMRLAGLCLAVLSFSFIEAQTSPPTSPPTTSGGEVCCSRKVVSGAGTMDGTYNYVKTFDGEKNENCYDGCIYTREGRTGEEYCFKWVDSGAANINDECEAPTGSSEPGSPGPTEPGSTPGETSPGSGPPPTGESTPPPAESTPPPTGESTPPPTGESTPPPTGESSQPPTGSSPESTTPPPPTGMTTNTPIGKRLNKYRIFN